MFALIRQSRSLLGPVILAFGLATSALALGGPIDQEPPLPGMTASDPVIFIEDVTEEGPAAASPTWRVLSTTADQDEGVKFGISLEEVDATLAAQLGIDAAKAIVVEKVAPGGAADKAGLKPHDVIVKVNGKPGTLENLQAQRDASAGKTPVHLEIRRRARRMVIVVWGPKSEIGVDARGLPGADRPGRRGVIGLGGGSAGPAGPTRAQPPQDREGYLREIREMRERLADLERRLRDDPRTGDRRRIRSRTPAGPAEVRPPQPTRRPAEGAVNEERAARQREMEMKRRAMVEEREREKAMLEADRAAMAGRIEAMAARRAAFQAELGELREALGRTENKRRKREIEEKMVMLETGMADLEAEIEAMRQELKRTRPAPHRERSAIDPRTIDGGRARIEKLNSQVEALENMLDAVESDRFDDPSRTRRLMKAEILDRVVELEKRDVEIAEKADRLENTRREIDRQAAQLNEKSKILEDRLAESEARLQAAQKKLAEAEARRRKKD